MLKYSRSKQKSVLNPKQQQKSSHFRKQGKLLKLHKKKQVISS